MYGKPDPRPERLPTPLKAIRLKCIDCCCGSKREVSASEAPRPSITGGMKRERSPSHLY